jgi:hypothetical protein
VLGARDEEWPQQATPAIRARAPLEVQRATIRRFPNVSEIYAAFARWASERGRNESARPDTEAGRRLQPAEWADDAQGSLVAARPSGIALIATTVLASMVGFLNASVVNVAVPAIGRDLPRGRQLPAVDPDELPVDGRRAALVERRAVHRGDQSSAPRRFAARDHFH